MSLEIKWVWGGHRGGWPAQRSPSSGDLTDQIPSPCARVTDSAFARPDLLTTDGPTALVNSSARALGQQTLAGGHLAFEAQGPRARHWPAPLWGEE